MAAQRIADAFVERELASSTSSLPPDAIRVVIQVAGEFDRQWFRWHHAHRSVSLTLRPAPGRSATFRGAGHPCQTGYCFTDDRPPGDGSAPTFAPVACAANELTRMHCEQSGVVSYVGYSFFAAEGDRAWFHDHHTTHDGFGSIHIEDIEVHDYHTAVRVAGWTAADVRARWPADARPDAVDAPVVGLQVTGCRFERIGEGFPGVTEGYYAIAGANQISFIPLFVNRKKLVLRHVSYRSHFWNVMTKTARVELDAIAPAKVVRIAGQDTIYYGV